jgi:hypothetical protein
MDMGATLRKACIGSLSACVFRVIVTSWWLGVLFLALTIPAGFARRFGAFYHRSVWFGIERNSPITNAAFSRNQMNPGIMNRRKQREQSAGAFSVVSVTSCSKMLAEKQEIAN